MSNLLAQIEVVRACAYCPSVPRQVPDIDATAADLAVPLSVVVALLWLFAWVCAIIAWVFLCILQYEILYMCLTVFIILNAEERTR